MLGRLNLRDLTISWILRVKDVRCHKLTLDEWENSDTINRNYKTRGKILLV